MTLASTRLEEVLLALKIAFLVLLYALIWRIVRTVSRDMRVRRRRRASSCRPSPPGRPACTGRAARRAGEPCAREGRRILRRLRAAHDRARRQNDVAIDGDEFASARHVRFEPRRDGVWVQDLGSTNGTYVNGVRIEGARRLDPGDVIRVGETDLRFDP